MSAWIDLGLPCPLVRDYGYTLDAGIARTAFAVSIPQQQRRRRHNQRTFQASWLLTAEQLTVAEIYLRASGFTWFELPLASGRVPDAGPTSLHTVRLTSSYQVAAEDRFRWRLTATLEERVLVERCEQIVCGPGEPVPCEYLSAFVCTQIYPLEQIESFAASARVIQAFSQVGATESLAVSTGLASVTVYGEAFGYDQSALGVTTSIEGVTTFGTQIWLDPDETSIQQVPTGGQVIEGIYFTVLESFEASAVVVGAELT